MKKTLTKIIYPLFLLLIGVSFAYGGATFSRLKTWSTGETMTASQLNAEFNNILNNLNPSGIDDESATDAAAQATSDPYAGDSLSKATSLQGEIQQLRYLIAQITGETYWYIDPDTDLATVGGDEWVTVDMIATAVAGDGLQGGAGDALAVDASEIAGDGLRDDGSENLAVDVSDFAGTGLEDDGSENLQIAAAAAGDGLQGGHGSALAVDVSDFAGTGLEDDGSENLRIAAAAAGDGLQGGGGNALAIKPSDFAGPFLEESAGGDLIISDGVVTVASMSNDEGAVEHTESSNVITDVVVIRTYVPKDPQTLYLTARIKIGDGAHVAHARLSVTGVGTSSSNASTSSTSYNWQQCGGLDMSGASSGWTTVVIQLQSSHSGTTAYLQGWTVIWRNT